MGEFTSFSLQRYDLNLYSHESKPLVNNFDCAALIRLREIKIGVFSSKTVVQFPVIFTHMIGKEIHQRFDIGPPFRKNQRACFEFWSLKDKRFTCLVIQFFWDE